jgi:hypothetical protein
LRRRPIDGLARPTTERIIDEVCDDLGRKR